MDVATIDTNINNIHTKGALLQERINKLRADAVQLQTDIATDRAWGTPTYTAVQGLAAGIAVNETRKSRMDQYLAQFDTMAAVATSVVSDIPDPDPGP